METIVITEGRRRTLTAGAATCERAASDAEGGLPLWKISDTRIATLHPIGEGGVASFDGYKETSAIAVEVWVAQSAAGGRPQSFWVGLSDQAGLGVGVADYEVIANCVAIPFSRITTDVVVGDERPLPAAT